MAASMPETKKKTAVDEAYDRYAFILHPGFWECVLVLCLGKGILPLPSPIGYRSCVHFILICILCFASFLFTDTAYTELADRLHYRRLEDALRASRTAANLPSTPTPPPIAPTYRHSATLEASYDGVGTSLCFHSDSGDTGGAMFWPDWHGRWGARYIDAAGYPREYSNTRTDLNSKMSKAWHSKEKVVQFAKQKHGHVLLQETQTEKCCGGTCGCTCSHSGAYDGASGDGVTGNGHGPGYRQPTTVPVLTKLGSTRRTRQPTQYGYGFSKTTSWRSGIAIALRASQEWERAQEEAWAEKQRMLQVQLREQKRMQTIKEHTLGQEQWQVPGQGIEQEKIVYSSARSSEVAIESCTPNDNVSGAWGELSDPPQEWLDGIDTAADELAIQMPPPPVTNGLGGHDRCRPDGDQDSAENDSRSIVVDDTDDDSNYDSEPLESPTNTILRYKCLTFIAPVNRHLRNSVHVRFQNENSDNHVPITRAIANKLRLYYSTPFTTTINNVAAASTDQIRDQFGLVYISPAAAVLTSMVGESDAGDGVGDKIVGGGDGTADNVHGSSRNLRGSSFGCAHSSGRSCAYNDDSGSESDPEMTRQLMTAEDSATGTLNRASTFRKGTWRLCTICSPCFPRSALVFGNMATTAAIGMDRESRLLCESETEICDPWSGGWNSAGSGGSGGPGQVTEGPWKSYVEKRKREGWLLE